MGRVGENLLFFREFFRTHHTTGAVLPSGRWLAAALSRYVAASPGCCDPGPGCCAPGPGPGCCSGTASTDGAGRPPKLVLEVGPGTGAVTRHIARALGPEDRFDMVELNDRFVEQLRASLQVDPVLLPIASRARVLHCSVQELPADVRYDVIVSGLPLNNFSAELVESILATLRRLLKPGGTLSFFQYIAIRHARALVSGRAERERLRGVGRALASVLEGNEVRRDWIWPNIPPAWVHHIRFQQANAVADRLDGSSDGS
jgi:phosphatidylethanolamine/phosphatidyl-N-methylethanolamine N-methyltransferase